jgi:type I pantothenate kinase
VDLQPIAAVAGDPDPGLALIAGHVRALAPSASPFLVGVTGGIAAGKSVFAARLQAALTAGGLQAAVVATDGFLQPNARLAELGLMDRKGFPPSYDTDALIAALAAIRRGPARFPAYSHITYDIDPALARTLDPPDVLIVEGLNLRRPGAAEALDLLIYLDADEADLEAWFTARFLGLWAAAEHDPTSFYVRFRHLDRAGAAGVAKWVWDGINLPNLRENVAPARAEADLVVRKAADHRLDALGLRARL